MASASLTAGKWEVFQDNPLPGVHPHYLTQSLAPLWVEDEGLFRQTVSADALKPAFLHLLRQRLNLKPLSSLTPSPLQASLLALDVEGWQETAEACGLMYWSSMLMRELRSPVLKALETRFGTSWWQWIERGRTATADLPPLVGAWPDNADDWVARIVQAGFAVLEAWILEQPEDLAGWLRCKQPPPVARADAAVRLEAAQATVLMTAWAQAAGARA